MPSSVPPPAEVTAEESSALLDRFALPGFTGSALIALGALAVGWVAPGSALATTTALDRLRAAPALAFAGKILVIAGVALLLHTWLLLGHHVRTHRVVEPRRLTRLVWWWSAPLVFAPALFSRDVFSYIAQSRLLPNGIDPYLYGTGVFDTWYADGADAMWTEAPAPYGPLWLGASSVVYWVTRAEPTAALLGFRLLALVGVLLVAVYLPRLAERNGADPAKAVWLGTLNPLLLLHFVAAGHNDALMVGLLVMGLTLAMEGRRLAGVVVVALAGAVKVPALVALPFVALTWARAGHAPFPRRLRAWITAGVVTVVTFLGLNLVTRLDFGWLSTLDTPGRVRTWLSASTGLGIVIGEAGRLLGMGQHGEATVTVTRAAATVLSLGVITWLALTADRRSLTRGLGLALLALVALGPVVQPWYLLWAIVPLAATRLRHRDTLAGVLLTVGAGVYSIANTGATVATYGELSDGVAVLLSLGVLGVLVSTPALRALVVEDVDVEATAHTPTPAIA